MPQQRTQNNRGQVQLPNRRPIPDMTWSVTGVTGSILTISIDADPARISLQSEPQFFCSSPAQTPQSVTLVGTTLSVTFPSAPTPGAAIELPSTSPGVRSDLGAYLAAGRYLTPIPPPAPPPVPVSAWVASITGSNSITIAQAAGGAESIVFDMAQFTTTSAWGPVTSAIVSSSGIVLSTASPVSMGDDLTVSGLGLTNGNAGLTVLGPGTVIL